MLVDANLLVYAVNRGAPEHERAAAWLTEQLNGDRRVALPWQSLSAFVRLTTHPRVMERPLAGVEAWRIVEGWLAVDVTWVPEPGRGFGAIVRRMIERTRAGGNLVPDLFLAALACEHGLPVASADSDFARFDEITWFDPLR